MVRKEVSRYLVFIFAVIALAILLIGKYTPSTTMSLTCRVSSTDNDNLGVRVEELLKHVDGIQPVCLDEKANLFTFRYDSGKTDIETVKSHMAGIGLKFDLIAPLNLVGTNSSKKRTKLISVQISSPSRD